MYLVCESQSIREIRFHSRPAFPHLLSPQGPRAFNYLLTLPVLQLQPIALCKSLPPLEPLHGSCVSL